MFTLKDKDRIKPAKKLQAEHELRVQVINHAGLTPNDEAFLELLQQYPPRTNIKVGDLAMLLEVPRHLAGQGPYPNIWEVRLVVSRFQFELHRLVHQTGGMFDFAIAQIEAARRLPPHRYTDPVFYAHAFPHGQWPSSAEWFPSWCLKRLMLRAPTEEWEPILDEFSSPYMGYDPSDFGAGIVFDLAPDIYDDQRRKTRPLSFEEDSFHRACLLGLEESCMVPSATEDLSSSASDIFDIWSGTPGSHSRSAFPEEELPGRFLRTDDPRVIIPE